jgi:MoxR-like ATPase
MSNAKRFLLRDIVHGYDEVEPAVITALALRTNIFFEGRHGIGKTMLGNTLGRAVDETGRGFRHYAADKANIITIGGLPDMERSSKTGRLQFMETDQSIWGSKIILVDELPRADKERQNYWLEILEQKTFNGLPVDYHMAIATGNLSTYRGNFDMDLALKSRFMFWLPSPSFEYVESNDVMTMIKMNLIGGRPTLSQVGTRINEALADIKAKYEASQTDADLTTQVSTWIGTFVQFVQGKVSGHAELSKNNDAYISPREFAVHMPRALLGLKAYFDHMGIPESLKLAGQHTVRYVIESRHASAGEEFTNITKMAWRQLSGMLVGRVDTPDGKLRYKFASSISAPQKMEFWREHIVNAVQVLPDADITNMAGDTLQQIRADSIGLIGPFWHVMKGETKTQHLANEVESFMITELARKILDGKTNPLGVNGKLWGKYQGHDYLQSHEVAEILDNAV